MQSATNITPEAYPVNNAGIYPGEKKEMKKKSEGLNMNNSNEMKRLKGGGEETFFSFSSFFSFPTILHTRFINF
jgi:hypothetical protein